MHRKNGHHNAQMKGHIARGAGLLLKYSEMVSTITTCPVYSKYHSRQLPKECGSIYQSSQLVGNWEIDYTDTLPLNEGSKYTLVYMDTDSGLTQAFSCFGASQADIIRRLEKLNPIYGGERLGRWWSRILSLSCPMDTTR